MAAPKSSGAVERRLQALGAESEQLRHQIRRLHEQLGVQSGVQPRSPGSWDARTGDLFAWAAKQRKFERTGSISVRRRPSGGRGGGLIQGASSRSRDPRLLAYLQSGSFGRPPPVREGNDVPRNRVLFFVAVGLVLAYVLYRIYSH